MSPSRRCTFSSVQAISATFNTIRTNGATPPSFLIPCVSKAQFSSSTHRPSKIGRASLPLPPEVTFTVIQPPVVESKREHDRVQALPTVEVVGPLGKLRMTIPTFVTIKETDEGRARTVSVRDETDKNQRAMWGTVRAYLSNHILGVSEGHTAILRLIGVGYRATVEKTATTVSPDYEGQEYVSLKVGYSHPIELGIPKGVKASTPQPTRILLEGIEKEVVMQFAAEIREWRRPEPYKGKGIFVNGETIKLKAKKIK